MTTLVMFSGGLDSTAMLYKLLTGSADELHVHHVHLRNRDGRARAESDAVAAVLAWCRAHCRPFSFSESALDFESLRAIPIDYLAVAYAACQVAIDVPRCNRIAIGTLAVDLDEVKRKVTQKQRRVFDAMYACYRERKLGEPVIEWLYPVYELTKAQVAQSLPAELRAVAWSCRRPVPVEGGYRICGECKPCRKRAEVSAQLQIAL
ncbi:MAG: hypothetical protein IT513_00815 [Burkholderiales bacterium]|nr:hypothetical protein [Burkholderiales bacterium]